MPDISEFSFTTLVRPIVQVGIGSVPVEHGTAMWDIAIWDEDTWVGHTGTAISEYGLWDVARWDQIASNAFWSGFEPDWYDITCETNSVEFQTGRLRTTDHFEVGSCSVTLDNGSGKYDMHWPAPPVDGQLAIIPGRPLRVGVYHVERGAIWMWRGYIDEVIPNYQPVERDVVLLNCIDALGEVSRSEIPKFEPKIRGNEICSSRVQWILDVAGWPKAGAKIDAASTPMLATEGGSSVANLLAVTVESEGGAIYGDRQGRVHLRGHDWQVYDQTAPVDASVGNLTVDAVCPTEFETSFRRQDIVTRVLIKRTTDDSSRVYEDKEGIALYGQEIWRAEDLICALPEQLPILAKRQLRVRSASIVPRVEAVHFDASNGADVVELMCDADPLVPSRWQVGLQQPQGKIFNRQMFVTGIRHAMERDSWTMRADLDLASPFAVTNEHRWEPNAATNTTWGHSQWQKAV